MKIIVDFDNTFTLHGTDVDDLIALLYLYSHPKVEIPFVCTTYGNGTLQEVNRCTRETFRNFGIDIPIYSGAEKTGEKNPAAEQTAKYIAKHPGQVHLLMLGSLQNAADLLTISPEAPDQIASFVAMGGITEPLHFLGRLIRELNFSVSAASSKKVLRTFRNPTVLTGNHCLEHIHTVCDLPDASVSPVMSAILRHHLEWMDYSEQIQTAPGVVLWDVLAAMYLTEPGRFTDQIHRFALTEQQMQTGLLVPDTNGFPVNTPTLRPDDRLYEHIFRQIATKF